ncbi:hypothetical protein FACS189454_00920 [Planctomycetales bacterium]|nr:hypothetical protein FACS189454_00920 [Planctomycetales bacterium]
MTAAASETETVKAIEAAFGIVQRDSNGVIIAVDLANERASATDEILRSALTLPNLKKLRVAGSTITPQTFAALQTQRELTELFLKDLTVSDADLAAALKSLTQLRQLTLRRLPNISVCPALPALRNLALIEITFSEKTFASLSELKELAALDLRNCSGLTIENYQTLNTLPKLIDLKIGGFSVNDDVLKTVKTIPRLTGLTIDDSLITPETFTDYVARSPSAKTIQTLVLNRVSTLLDDNLTALRELPNLNRLTVCDLMVTGEFLGELAADENKRPKLKTLSLRKTLLTSEGAAFLVKYKELTTLDLSFTNFDGDIAKAVIQLPALTSLNLQGCQISDETLNVLKTNKALQIKK